MHRGKMPSQRQLRVGEEIRHALADLLMRGELRDPALSEVTLTVTEVRASPDLRNATVFVVPLGGAEGAERKAILDALRRASAFLRGRLAQSVRLKYTPALSFHYDDSFDVGDAIDRLLRDDPVVAQDLKD